MAIGRIPPDPPLPRGRIRAVYPGEGGSVVLTSRTRRDPVEASAHGLQTRGGPGGSPGTHADGLPAASRSRARSLCGDRRIPTGIRVSPGIVRVGKPSLPGATGPGIRGPGVRIVDPAQIEPVSSRNPGDSASQRGYPVQRRDQAMGALRFPIPSHRCRGFSRVRQDLPGGEGDAIEIAPRSPDRSGRRVRECGGAVGSGRFYITRRPKLYGIDTSAVGQVLILRSRPEPLRNRKVHSCSGKADRYGKRRGGGTDLSGQRGDSRSEGHPPRRSSARGG